MPSAVSVITSGGLTARTIRISSGKIKTGGVLGSDGQPTCLE